MTWHRNNVNLHCQPFIATPNIVYRTRRARRGLSATPSLACKTRLLSSLEQIMATDLLLSPTRRQDDLSYHSSREDRSTTTPPPDYDAFLSENDLPSARSRAFNNSLRERRAAPTIRNYVTFKVSSKPQLKYAQTPVKVLICLSINTG